MTDPQKAERLQGARRISLSLPAKITGIVFWGLVLVGLLVAVFLLDLRTRELGYRYQLEANIIAYELENAIEQSDLEGDLSSSVYASFTGLQKNYPLKGVEFIYHDHHYRFGEISSFFDLYPFQLQIHHRATQQQDSVELLIYMPALVDEAELQRKDVLLAIGALLLLFGLILQRILQKVLSQPFLGMVSTAEDFAGGDNQQRFDEQRADEFGYLAKFINRALDASLKQQRELELSRNALFEEKERAEVTLHSIMDAVITTNAAGRVQYMNPATERLTGWTNERARDIPLTKVIRLMDEESGEKLKNPIERCLRENTVVDLLGHASLVRLDGEPVAIEASAAPMRNRQGQVIGAVMVIQDVSHARRLTRQL
ncbi:MAG: PAS domain S-box protein, partial [Gammaproteobacteria bacterium]